MNTLTQVKKNAKRIIHVSFQRVHKIAKIVNNLVFLCNRLNAFKYLFLIQGLHVALQR